jgi:hypothetical protein
MAKLSEIELRAWLRSIEWPGDQYGLPEHIPFDIIDKRILPTIQVEIDALKSELAESEEERDMNRRGIEEGMCRENHLRKQLADSPCGVKGHIARDLVEGRGSSPNRMASAFGNKPENSYCERCVEVQKAVAEALERAATLMEDGEKFPGMTIHDCVSGNKHAAKIRALIPPVSKERTK